MNESRTFGQAFGELIREKRGQEGLTQRDLAIRAFDDESKVRRIIELEGGQVHRPQAKTVDALRVYFGITAEEMSLCQRLGLFSQQEGEKLGLARSLLENLAMRFDHDNPDAPDEELLTYLKTKATELREIKRRLSELDESSESIANQINAANAALDIGHFDEADQLLASIEEVQQEERTLREVRRQVGVRAARGDSALFQGRHDIATAHYLTAAEYVLPFNKEEAAYLMETYAGRLYERERRLPNGSLVGALSLATKAFNLSSASTEPEDRSQRAYHLALIELSHARTQNIAALDILTSATKHAEEALGTGQGVITDYDWASCKIALANILLLRGELDGQGSRHTRAATEIFEELLSSQRTRKLGMHLCHLHNNLSAAQRQLARTANDSERERLLIKAHSHLMHAIERSSIEGEGDVWLSAQHNLGALLAERAQHLEGEEAAFARLQAIAAFQASIEMFPKETFTSKFGETHIALGRVLFDHASKVPPEIGEIYLIRSIAANETASRVFSKEQNGIKWAEAQFHIAAAFLQHAEIADATVARGDLERALSHFDEAESHFIGPKTRKYLEMCQSARKYAAEKLSSMSESNARD